MKKRWFDLCIWGLTIVLMMATWRYLSAAASPQDAQAADIVVNHNAVDAAQIPQEWLDAARELDIFFAHMSVGNNILTGMADLQSQDPDRYTIDISTASANWFVANNGILHRSLATNGLPLDKISRFDAYISADYNVSDIVMMKFCPADTIPFGTVAAADIWTSYRDTMISLQQTYPDTLFVWWTIPVTTAARDRGNDEKEIFNGLVRSYCDANNCVLFDIADIESHDPDGNPVTSDTGIEAMWSGYSDDGGHLNETGRVRVAEAYWWLLARIAVREGRPYFLPIILRQ